MASIIVDFPSLAPGKCYNCGSGDNKDGRRYVQTPIHLKWYGRVYICGWCMVELAKEFGLVASETYEEMGEMNFRLIEDMNTLKEQNDRLRIALSNIDFLGSRSGFNLANEKDGNKGTTGPSESGKGKDSGPVESGTKSGPVNVRKSNSDSKSAA